MSRRLTYVASLSRGGDTPTWEGTATVSFTVIPGEPETGPSYACGGTPATDAQVEDIVVEMVDGKARPWGMYSGYIANEDDEFAREVVEDLEGSEYHLGQMLLIAGEAEADDRDAAAEARAESMAEDRRNGW